MHRTVFVFNLKLLCRGVVVYGRIGGKGEIKTMFAETEFYVAQGMTAVVDQVGIRYGGMAAVINAFHGSIDLVTVGIHAKAIKAQSDVRNGDYRSDLCSTAT